MWEVLLVWEVHMKFIKEGDRNCNHAWKKVDIDDRFKKEGVFEVARKKSRCTKCGAEIIRKVRRRY
jgi:hypothetical protein